MSDAAVDRERGTRAVRRSTSRPLTMPVGWLLLVPGLAHGRWGQPQRAQIYLGSFLSALAIGVFTWGTWLSAPMLAWAFAVHVAALADALRQRTLPTPPSPMIVGAVGTGLALVGYLPALLAAGVFASPQLTGGSSPSQYLVDRAAYRQSMAQVGEWVWFASRARPDLAGPGRVIARAGERVELIGGILRVEGRSLEWARRQRNDRLTDLALLVPEGHLMVLVEDGAGGTPPIALVEAGAVRGRPWLRMHPFGRRGLLFGEPA